jgi:hypothetical protein
LMRLILTCFQASRMLESVSSALRPYSTAAAAATATATATAVYLLSPSSFQSTKALLASTGNDQSSICAAVAAAAVSLTFSSQALHELLCPPNALPRSRHRLPPYPANRTNHHVFSMITST